MELPAKSWNSVGLQHANTVRVSKVRASGCPRDHRDLQQRPNLNAKCRDDEAGREYGPTMPTVKVTPIGRIVRNHLTSIPAKLEGTERFEKLVLYTSGWLATPPSGRKPQGSLGSSAGLDGLFLPVKLRLQSNAP